MALRRRVSSARAEAFTPAGVATIAGFLRHIKARTAPSPDHEHEEGPEADRRSFSDAIDKSGRVGDPL